MNYRLKKLNNNQDGIVAIVVTLIIMIVITLIVVGFAQLARREQREALDRQLSTQAFYAAESGINDARRLIEGNINLEKRDDCGDGGIVGYNPKLGADEVNSYPCLLIKQKLDELKYQNVKTDKSTIVPVNPVSAGGGAGTDNLVISWQNKDGANTFSPESGFPPATTWGSENVGLLRIDLVNVDPPFTADSLREKTFTAFLRPKKTYTAGDGTVDFDVSSPNNQGKIVSADCRTSLHKRLCAVTINNVMIGKKYYLRMKSIYNIADVSLCASNCDGTVVLNGAQAEIDSTGRANDVLKRIQVRVPTEPELSGDTIFPEYAVDSSESICKLYSVWPNDGREGICPN